MNVFQVYYTLPVYTVQVEEVLRYFPAVKVLTQHYEILHYK